MASKKMKGETEKGDSSVSSKDDYLYDDDTYEDDIDHITVTEFVVGDTVRFRALRSGSYPWDAKTFESSGENVQDILAEFSLEYPTADIVDVGGRVVKVDQESNSIELFVLDRIESVLIGNDVPQKLEKISQNQSGESCVISVYAPIRENAVHLIVDVNNILSDSVHFLRRMNPPLMNYLYTRILDKNKVEKSARSSVIESDYLMKIAQEYADDDHAPTVPAKDSNSIQVTLHTKSGRDIKGDEFVYALECSNIDEFQQRHKYKRFDEKG